VSERDPNELGALWEKTGKKGTYFTGKIGDQPVVVFKNGNKQPGSNAPDWRVLKPQKQDAPAAPASGHNLNEPVNDRDIPF
jgi:uncharacterized protein (DUF736 family)